MQHSAWRWLEGELWLQLYVQPKASQDKLIGLHGEAIKLSITALPVAGKANTHLQHLLAKLFAVSRSQVTVEKGELSRYKQVRIQAPQRIPAILNELGLRPEES